MVPEVSFSFHVDIGLSAATTWSNDAVGVVVDAAAVPEQAPSVTVPEVSTAAPKATHTLYPDPSDKVTWPLAGCRR